MLLTAKIKLLRILSVIQCFIALSMIVLGIVERVCFPKWTLSKLGVPIWTGIWVAITGSFGVFISFKRLQQSSDIINIPQHLVMTLMSFSLTSGVLSSIIILHYGSATLILWDAKEKDPSNNDNALVACIFASTLAELIVAMWSATLCFISDQKASVTNEPYKIDPLMEGSGRGPEASGSAILNV